MLTAKVIDVKGLNATAAATVFAGVYEYLNVLDNK
jgi:hypothetical protein